MIRAIKAVSTERGRDPREFALFAFGGNGPVFACGMAAALGMRRVVVPPSAGLFSSFGLLYADVEHHYSRTFRRLLRKSRPSGSDQAPGTRSPNRRPTSLRPRGLPRRKRKIRRSAALHYHGQTYELTVAVARRPDRLRVSGGGVRPRARENLRPPRRRRRAGRAGLDPGRGPGAARRPEHSANACARAAAEPQPPPPRRAYFGSWIETPVMRRSDLSQAKNRAHDRRGVRRHLRRSARRASRARRRRQHRHRPLALAFMYPMRYSVQVDPRAADRGSR